MTTPKLRFAPSPTGLLHVGNARTALFNYLYARHSGGRFVLRIEDTDRERSTAESESSIEKDLRWLGISWDEGPDCGGDGGPYRQSERTELYLAAAEKLKQAGKAYHCFCQPEELERQRQEAMARGDTPRYSGACLRLPEEEVRRRLDVSLPAALRFHVDGGDITFNDLVRGKVSFEAAQFGDFVLVRSNGDPAYNFAVVVDDSLMGITHVIRGEDHISNTPKQLLLYGALGSSPPAFAHLPMILGPDHHRLSKRHGAVSVRQFRREGILPQSLTNFLSLLGWSPGDDREILTMEELIQEFDLGRVSHSNSVFNPEKLSWMNGVYLRNAPLEYLRDEVARVLCEGGHLKPEEALLQQERLTGIAELLTPSLRTMNDLASQAHLFFASDLDYSAETLERLAGPSEISVITGLANSLPAAGDLTAEAFRTSLKEVQKTLKIKGKGLYQPVRLAITDQEHGPDLDRLASLIGLPLVRRRLLRFAQPESEQER